jgi:putative FmdB family regulatory protein
MPTYEYECTACGQHVEVFQRFSEDALTECGVCGGPLRKVFHPAGIVFKGSGFYATDSRSSAAAGPKREKETTSSGTSGSEGGSSSTGADGSTSKGNDGGTGSKSGTTKEPSPS